MILVSPISARLTLKRTLICLTSIYLVFSNVFQAVTSITTHKRSTLDLHNYLTNSERILLLGSSTEVPAYEVLETDSSRNILRNNSSSRRKRSPGQEEFDGDKRPKELRVNLTVFGEKLRFEITPNDHLVSPGFRIQQEPFSKSFDANVGQKCYYQGKCVGGTSCSVAVSLCEKGMRGVIETDQGLYLIQPLPEAVLRRSGRLYENGTSTVPHIVVKQDNSEPYQCPHKRSKDNKRNGYELPPSSMHYKSQPSPSYHPERDAYPYSRRSNYPPSSSGTTYNSYQSAYDSMRLNGRRQKRSVPYGKAVVIETAVFVDQALHDVMRKAFPSDTGAQLINYVLTIMNAVQLLFRQSSLGRSLELSLVMLDVLQTQPDDLRPSDNIDTYLTNFCVWQHKRRMYLRSGQPRWDHALLLSGINMYVVDDRGRRKRHVVGLAPVSGMCNPLNSCTISEGTSFQTVLVAGHEIGHSLGMEHDGPQDGNLCDPNHFIMSPTLGAGKTTWSTCSREYLDKFLRTSQAYCLTTLNSAPGSSPYPLPQDLPGDKFDADQQCVLRYGKGSRRSVLQSPEEVCRILRCETGSHGSGISFTAHPALEGTRCGRDRWCRAGRCASRQEAVMAAPQRAVPGGWSAWSPFSNCYSDCVMRDNEVVGVMVSRRRCDNPTPQNGGKFCDGGEKRSRMCDARNICGNSRELPLDQYIADTCLRASIRDSSIESRGTQFPSSDSSHSCYVWCHKRGGGFMTHGWKIPDGTPCWKQGGVKQNRYCLNGKCQAYDCNGQSTDGTQEELQCSSSGISERRLVWRETSDCRSTCMLGGTGFQLATRDCNSITGCPVNRDSFKLCDKTCMTTRTTQEYANEVCHRYSIKYPNLLSGGGRQLPSRAGNRHSACVVACQDRVWKDTHYQMDVFEDGMFPFGTDCSGSDRRYKAYCLRGRCLEFDHQNMPVDKNVIHVVEMRKLIKGVWKRDLNAMSILESAAVSNRTGATNVLAGRNVTSRGYQWAVAVSDCTKPCGGGKAYISLSCHLDGRKVSNKLCLQAQKPTNPGWMTCNDHPCTGRWRVGEWGNCSSTCGFGIRKRSVVCIQEVEEKLFALVEERFCPLLAPISNETCLLPRCTL